MITKSTPSGNALLILRTAIRLLTSLLMLLATPGYYKYIWYKQTKKTLSQFFIIISCYHCFYCFTVDKCISLTWIFIATSLPSFILARCTWPIEAAAKGFSSKNSNLSRQFGPKSLLTAFCHRKKSQQNLLQGAYVRLPFCTIQSICMNITRAMPFVKPFFFF